MKVFLQIYRGKPWGGMSPMIGKEDSIIAQTKIDGKTNLISFRSEEECYKWCDSFKKQYPNFNKNESEDNNNLSS